MKPTQILKNQYLIKEDDKLDKVYIIHNGEFEVTS